MGKTRVVAETGAGQHGVATATVCALLGLECVVYMGTEDMARQAPNVQRMRLLGAEVRGVDSGSRTLKDAINEAMRDWVTNVRTTHYLLGSVLGAHPYPMMVRDFQSVIGAEARAQVLAQAGRLPDLLVACVGGGSNAIGLFPAFLRRSGGPDGGGGGGRPLAHDRASTRRASSARAPAVSACCRARARTCSRTRRATSCPRTPSPRASTIPAIGPEHALLHDEGRVQYAAAATRRRWPPSDLLRSGGHHPRPGVVARPGLAGARGAQDLAGRLVVVNL